MGYDNVRKFNGIFTQIGVQIPFDYSNEDSRVLTKTLDTFAKEIRGNKSIPIYWKRNTHMYFIRVADVSEHHISILKDLNYTITIVKVSRGNRQKYGWLKLKKDK